LWGLFSLKEKKGNMNPKDFDWKEDQQVTVKNPTEEDFKFKVHSKDYVVEAGSSAKMPGYIAWMFVHKLATKMAMDNDDFIHWNEEGFRQKYYSQIVVQTDDLVQTFKPKPKPQNLSTTRPATASTASKPDDKKV
jgi:hypothetical protein